MPPGGPQLWEQLVQLVQFETEQFFTTGQEMLAQICVSFIAGQASSYVVGSAVRRATVDTAVMLRTRVRVPFPQLLVQLVQLLHAVTLQGTGGRHNSATQASQYLPSGM